MIMKVRKTKEIKKILLQKGFISEPSKDHHEFYYLEVDGKKHAVYTYLSHGMKEYSVSLMMQIKKQLKFRVAKKADDFFDCPLSAEEYIQMLKENGDL